MATGTWTGAASNVWPLNANWSGPSYPGTVASETASVNLAPGGTISLNGTSITNLAGLSTSGGGTWSITRTAAETFYAATATIDTPTTLSATLAGAAGAFTKAGTSTLTLTAGASNTGAWAINAGTLAVTTSAVTAGSGAITVAAGATLTTSVGIAKPIVANGTVTISSGGSFTGAQTYGNAAGALAKVTIGGTITASGGSFNIASNATARVAVYQSANVAYTFSSAAAGLSLGYASGSTPYAYWNGTGGTLTTSVGYLLVGVGYAGSGAGLAGSPVVMDIDGTTLNLGDRFWIGNSSVSSAVVNILSGTHTHSSVSPLNIGGAGGTLSTAVTGAATTQQRLTLQGSTTSMTAGGLTMAADAAGALSQVNLLGGASLTVASGALTLATPKQINLINGSSFSTSGLITQTGGSFTLTLYGNGNRIGSGAGTGILPAVIRDAAGNGVTSITNTAGNEGVGYIGPPVVVLTGGGGTGASARAVWDKNTQTISGFEITNPGTGYTSSPTVVLSGATVANNCCTTAVNPLLLTVNIGTNATDGSVEKTGSGSLTLTATNTNTGTYTVTAGTLKVGNGADSGTMGLNDASPVVIGTGSTLNFNRTDSPTYSNLISGAGGISKTSGAAGTFTTLSTANTFTGPVTVTTGALRATHANAVGTGSGSVTVASGASFEIAGGINLNSNRGATIAGTGLGGLGALRNVLGDNTIAGPIALSAAATIGSDAGTLTLSSTATTSLGANALSLIGAGNIDLSPVFSGAATVTKTSGTGVAILRGSSTYTGKTTVTAGTIGYKTTAGSGAASSLGAPTIAASLIVDVAGGATVGASAGLRFVGIADQIFSRVINVTGTNAAGLTVRIEASSNTAKVTHSTAFTNTTLNQIRNYQFGGTGTTDNTVSFIIANNGTGATSVVKADTGKWVHSAANTYTGTLAVNGGTLTLSNTNMPSSVSVSNVGTVLVAFSPTGAARFGTGTVTVNTGAKIQTLTASSQNGKHTYTNLTFNGGGIRIGG